MKIFRFSLQFAFLGLSAFGQAGAQVIPATYSEANGLRLTCYAPHLNGGRRVPVAGTNGFANGQWGVATYREGWPIIIFDVGELSRLPPIVARFTYFHECAHLAIPTMDEIEANCAALREMRLNGMLTPEDEEQLATVTKSVGVLPQKYGGNGVAFWNLTERCADSM